MRTEQRFVGFDILKFICAFLIVCIHSPIPGTVGVYIIVLARIAVPIFFMITGYYYVDISQQGKVSAQIRKILMLTVEANAMFFFWKLSCSVIFGDGVVDFFCEISSLKNIIKLILLNESPLNGHLWYLGAILYVLLIMPLVDKFGMRKILFVLTLLLLIVDLVIGKYSLLLLHHEFPYILARNYLIVGIPYFAIGLILRSAEWRINAKLLIFLCITFSLSTFVEHYFLVCFDLMLPEITISVPLFFQSVYFC